MKKRKKISLVKNRVANLNSLLGGNDGDTGTGATQTEEKKSKIIIMCKPPGEQSKNGGMGCPDAPQVSNVNTTPCI